MKKVLFIAILIFAAVPAMAHLEYRVDPCNGSDWSVGTQHVVTLQVRSTVGVVTLYSVEVWTDYLEETLGTYVGALRLDSGTNLVPLTELDSTSSDYTDDGQIQYSQFSGGSAPGALVDGDWRDLASFTFTVLNDTPHAFHFILDFNFLFAFDMGFNEVTGQGLLCGSGWTPGTYQGDPTGIELLSFEAEAVDQSVVVSWETAAERDNAGFYVLRSRDAASGYERVTASVIGAEGDEFTGAAYEWIDGTVTDGTYYYKLEDVDIRGTSTLHGPVSVTVQAEPFACGMVRGSSGVGLTLVLALVLGAALISRKRGYTKPEVKTTSKDEVIRKAGPAQTCSPSPTACQTGE